MVQHVAESLDCLEEMDVILSERNIGDTSMITLVTNVLFRKWLTKFLQRIGRKYPETFKDIVQDLDLKPLVERVIIDRYTRSIKWEAFDYIDPRTARSYNKIFLDKFISRQK